MMPKKDNILSSILSFYYILSNIYCTCDESATKSATNLSPPVVLGINAPDCKKGRKKEPSPRPSYPQKQSF